MSKWSFECRMQYALRQLLLSIFIEAAEMSGVFLCAMQTLYATSFAGELPNMVNNSRNKLILLLAFFTGGCKFIPMLGTECQ